MPRQRPSTPAFERAIAFAALLATFIVAALFVMNDSAGAGYAWHGLPLDDSWIHQVYARSVATGRPYQYNPGEWETGATSPLWSILLAPGLWIGAPVFFSKLLCTLLLAAASFMGARLTRRFSGDAAGLGFAIALPLVPHFSFAAVSGMEVTLAAFLMLFTIERGLAGRWTLAAILSGLAILARPEASILPPLLCLAFVLENRPRPFESVDVGQGYTPRRSGRATEHGSSDYGNSPVRRHVIGCARIVALAFVVVSPWLIYCLAVSGRPLPATVYAKSDWLLPAFGDQLAVLGRSLGFQPFLGFSLGGVGLQLLGGALGALLIVFGARRVLRRRGWSAPALLCGFPVLYLLGLLVAVPLGAPLPPDRPGSSLNFYFARYLLLALPPLLLLWIVGLHELVERVSTLRNRGSDRRGLNEASETGRGSWAHAIALLFLALPIGSTIVALPRLAAIYSWNCRNIEEQQVAAGRWIAANLPRGESICVSDAGAIRFFGNHRVVDLVGLNSHRLLPLVQAAEAAPRESPEQIALRDRFWTTERPTYFAITSGWHGALLAGKLVQLEHSIEIENNTICAGSELLILKAGE